MRKWIGTILLCFLAGNGTGQDYGRLKTPEGPAEKQSIQTADATRQIIALERMVDPNSYILGPGDEIGLNILTSETLTFPLTITPTGDLFIPSVGVCHVAGVSLADAIIQVQKFVNQNAFPKAQTFMVLLNMRQFKILVSGAVNKPGFVSITPISRLDETISLAEGFHQLAKEFAIEIIRANGDVELINYHNFVLNGDLISNPHFLEGDEVRVPFGEVIENGIVVRGSIAGAGYDIISTGETLGNYIRRQVVFRNSADLQNVTISREVGGKSTVLILNPLDFSRTELRAGDVVNFMWERGVTVIGFVQAPGGFSYFPGYSVSDYIALAGGNTPNGNPLAVSTQHLDGTQETGTDINVLRGDIIYVPRARKDIYFGDLSILQILTSAASLVLAYLATVK